jgi:hypothetical protein
VRVISLMQQSDDVANDGGAYECDGAKIPPAGPAAALVQQAANKRCGCAAALASAAAQLCRSCRRTHPADRPKKDTPSVSGRTCCLDGVESKFIQ